MPITYSVKQVAEQTSLGRRTLWEAIAEGKLAVVRVGARVLVTPDALDDFIFGRTPKNTAKTIRRGLAKPAKTAHRSAMTRISRRSRKTEAIDRGAGRHREPAESASTTALEMS